MLEKLHTLVLLVVSCEVFFLASLIAVFTAEKAVERENVEIGEEKEPLMLMVYGFRRH